MRENARVNTLGFCRFVSDRVKTALLMSCALLSISSLTAVAGDSPSRFDPRSLDACAEAKIAAAGTTLDAGIARFQHIEDPGADRTDVQHYRFEFEVFPGTQTLSGSNTMTVASRVDDLTDFRFWLHDSMTISSVQIGGSAVTWHRGAAGAVDVELDQSYDEGDIFELEVGYDGSPVMNGFFSTQGQADAVSTLSQPWHAYEWWPVKDDNTDKATGEMLITVPSSMIAVANGAFVGVDRPTFTTRRFLWSTNYPTSPYLFAFSATQYNTFETTFSLDGTSMPVEFFIYPGSDTTANRDGWLRTSEMLSVFSELYGPYPFMDEKYAIYQFVFGGGMEHQTATGQGGNSAFSENLTAHELGHQWWGDMVTCANWNHIWLNEGFATYSSALWFEFETGSSDPAALDDYMSWIRPNPLDGTVYVYDATDARRIFSGNYSYRKGAWVVHMLRGVVGDDTFFDILEVYRERYRFATATTEDFQAVAEEVWGHDLEWFFERWIYGGGAPAYRYGWQEHEIRGRRYLEISLDQVQTEDAFEMPIQIDTIGIDQRHHHTVQNDARSQHFLIPIPAAVNHLGFDPDRWILTRSAAEVPFVNGPPRIVATEPVSGAAMRPNRVLTASVSFHEDVVVEPSNVILRRIDGTIVEADVTYDSATFTAGVVSRQPLTAGRYELVVTDGVVDATGGLALDGELGPGRGTTALPSGDGIAGGDAIIQFYAPAYRRPQARRKAAQ